MNDNSLKKNVRQFKNHLNIWQNQFMDEFEAQTHKKYNAGLKSKVW